MKKSQKLAGLAQQNGFWANIFAEFAEGPTKPNLPEKSVIFVKPLVTNAVSSSLFLTDYYIAKKAILKTKKC
jgi:hypothetical protein